MLETLEPCRFDAAAIVFLPWGDLQIEQVLAVLVRHVLPAPVARRRTRRRAPEQRSIVGRCASADREQILPVERMRRVGHRSGDGENLLPVCTGAPSHDRTLFWRTATLAAARDGRWKYVADEDGEHLFDLEIDPGEKDDRRLVDVARFERLKQQYLDWNARMLPRPSSSLQ